MSSRRFSPRAAGPCMGWLAALWLCAALLAGPALTPQTLRADDADPAPAPPPKNPLLEPDEAQQKAELDFLHGVETSINTGDGSAFDKGLDFTALIRQSAKGLGLNSKELTDLTAALSGSFHLGSAISKALQAGGGSYKLLNVRTVGKERHALFRMMPSAESLNYHDLVLSKNGRNQYCIADAYIFVSGENLSATMRRILAPMVAQDKPDAKKLLSPAEIAMVDHLKDVNSLYQARNAGKFAEAWAIYKAFPQELREDKNMLLTAIQIAQKNSDDDYLAILKDYSRLFPNDPALDLMSIDTFFMEKKYDAALVCFDHLDKRIGPEAMLLTRRANCLAELKKYAEAETCCAKAIEMEKTLENPYYTLIELSIDQKKWDAVAATMTAFEENIGRPYGDIAKNNLFVDFLASDPGKKWQADHAK